MGLVLAGGFAAAMWLPFVISEPSSLRHLSPTVQLADDSTLAVLGFESLDTSIGLRVSQLMIGLAVAYAFTIFGRPHAALPAAIAARMLVDPGTWNYYTSGLILACIVWQLRNRDAILPWLALMASVGLTPAHFIDDPTIRGIVRMMTLAGVLVAVAVSSQRDPGRAPIDQGP